MSKETKKQILISLAIGAVVILLAGCFLSGCAKANKSGDRKLSAASESESKVVNIDVLDRNIDSNIPEHRPEIKRSGDSVSNSWNGNSSNECGLDLLSEGDVLGVYSLHDSGIGYNFIYKGRSDILEHEAAMDKLEAIAFWSVLSGLIMLITGIAIGSNNSKKVKTAINELEQLTDLNNDGKIDKKDLQLLLERLRK